MKINTNSNAYTLVYASVVVVIVAFLLAFVSKSLESASQANERIDKKKQILASLNVRNVSNADVEKEYDRCVAFDMVIRSDGSVRKEGAGKDKDGFTIGSKDTGDDNLPLYQCNVDGETKYVIPVYGKGLWGPVWGYIALDNDRNTVYGVYFGHQSETAGLGSRITEEGFQSEFVGKKIFADGDGNVALSVVKKRDPAMEQYQCDAISGATLTTDGVSDMIQDCMVKYKAFLQGN